MKKKYIVLGCIFLSIFTLNAFLKPHLKKREVRTIIEVTLDAWTRDDISKVMENWTRDKINDIPPIYGLIAYKITNINFFKKDGEYFVDVAARLDFSAIDAFPTGREWVFNLKDEQFGWRIFNLQLK